MNTLKFYRPIKVDSLKAILRYLPAVRDLRAEEVFVHSPGELLDEEPITIRMHGEYHPLVHEFLRALYEHAFVQDYDWPEYMGRALEIYKHPAMLRRASLRTCVKLLTLHVRRDRFVDGHFAAMLAEGHVRRILERLAALHIP